MAERLRSRSGDAPPRLGSEIPRIFTPPLRKLSAKTSLGFACIRFAENILRIELYPWQKWFFIHALELLPDGSFRFRTIVLLVARQNGKSMAMLVLALFMMYVRGVGLVIGTAQNLDVAEEVWDAAVALAEETPELATEVRQVVRVNGKKTLKLEGGERYKVAAANRRGGRGLSGDLVLLDELREHQTWQAWAAVTKTTMARALALILAVSNAGDAASVVLRYLRLLAHKALGDPDGICDRSDDEDEPPDDIEEEDEDTLAIFEWSASPNADRQDRDAWAQANPSLGYGITERAIASAARTDPEWVFATEVLCQWPDGALEDIFPEGTWGAGRDPRSRVDHGYGFAVDVTPDRSRATISVAGIRRDGLAHLEVAQSSSGTRWAPRRLKAMVDTRGGEVALDPSGPAGALIPALTELGIEPRLLSTAEYARACAFIVDEVTEGRVKHLAQPEHTDAIAGTVKTAVGDGGFKWSRKDSLVDISAFTSSTIALWIVAGEPPDYDVMDSIG